METSIITIDQLMDELQNSTSSAADVAAARISNNQIVMFDIPLAIEPDALDALPGEATVFIINKLNQKCSVFCGWNWYDIGWLFGDKQYIRLCSTGSPAKDMGVVWAYNLKTSKYERYQTQYHPPISAIGAPDRVICTFNELISSL